MKNNKVMEHIMVGMATFTLCSSLIGMTAKAAETPQPVLTDIHPGTGDKPEDTSKPITDPQPTSPDKDTKPGEVTQPDHPGEVTNPKYPNIPITDITVPANPILQDMGKYATPNRNEQDKSLVVHVSSQQFLLYLKDKGVSDTIIPDSLKTQKSFEVFKLTFYKDTADKGVKFCLSDEGSDLYQNKALSKYFESLLNELYGSYLSKV